MNKVLVMFCFMSMVHGTLVSMDYHNGNNRRQYTQYDVDQAYNRGKRDGVIVTSVCQGCFYGCLFFACLNGAVFTCSQSLNACNNNLHYCGKNLKKLREKMQ